MQVFEKAIIWVIGSLIGCALIGWVVEKTEHGDGYSCDDGGEWDDDDD